MWHNILCVCFVCNLRACEAPCGLTIDWSVLILCLWRNRVVNWCVAFSKLPSASILSYLCLMGNLPPCLLPERPIYSGDSSPAWSLFCASEAPTIEQGLHPSGRFIGRLETFRNHHRRTRNPQCMIFEKSLLPFNQSTPALCVRSRCICCTCVQCTAENEPESPFILLLIGRFWLRYYCYAFVWFYEMFWFPLLPKGVILFFVIAGFNVVDPK